MLTKKRIGEFNIKEIVDFFGTEQSLGNDYWQKEREVLSKTSKRTKRRINLITMSDRKKHKTFSL
ncbi:hypothetical protein GCM10012288_24180 [Malaciobacter pacificus]|uniref:Uncharacterized protein n=1 Tax=Malaciobacter pacificus TaxID=1080223 RepID=A0A5C2HG14_9BACT|nr:hypothetical protein [Malaciobacter pacificus]QEP35362.1 hypothetical protein APAC_2302 [Malaciobacter pacificus]GGD49243.1 hypothetical protein GCM10012288_24180 [Malaciobacter pacificus]